MGSPFDVVNNILKKENKLSPEQIESDVNVWMVRKIMSNEQSLVHLMNALNRSNITKSMFYDCLYNGLPKTKMYIPYNSKKEKVDKTIQYLMDYFKCSQATAKQYIDLISPEEKEYIINYYETRGKKI